MIPAETSGGFPVRVAHFSDMRTTVHFDKNERPSMAEPRLRTAYRKEWI
jgi:hypothetical protein